MPCASPTDALRALAAAAALASACGPDPGFEAAIQGGPRSAASLEAQQERQRAAGAGARQILFGDLHVHTSYSFDGFLFSLPLLDGDGAHPPNDACDFARHCAQLDFYALTDHAESMRPEHWERSAASVRQCNALAGDPAAPDLVAFLGFEWSQAGLVPEEHWGHRCVIFPGEGEGDLPTRPIASADTTATLREVAGLVAQARWLSPWTFGVHTGFLDYVEALAALERCPEGGDPRALPADCREIAPTPRELHAKLDAWGLPALTIPHGTTWGVYTPATADIRKHLAPDAYDPERMRLIEIMSGHGNTENYRGWRELELHGGEAFCPEPTPDYLPCCWQAGEILRGRCGELPADECERRVEQTRRAAARAWTRPNQVLPDARPEEWLDCGQCRDCFKPSFAYRPRESVQYAMALSEGGPEAPRRFRYGFVGSSDGHTGRPGAGYKQLEPGMVSDTRGVPPFPYSLLTSIVAGGGGGEAIDRPLEPVAAPAGVRGNDLRVASFLYPGGLAAVHARGRDRTAIWDALQRREVYATSGPRILLWFDLLRPDGSRRPMGSEVVQRESPRFEVRALGSFEPQPGCPAESLAALSPGRLERLCRGECYHPSGRRRPIAAIEVVRIRPQRHPDEPLEGLIDDPWRRFPCAPDPAGCSVQLQDLEYSPAGRDALYYARALEVASPALNGRPLETVFDAAGRAVSVRPCLQAEVEAGGCPAPAQERAWSSPIFVDQPAETQGSRGSRR